MPGIGGNAGGHSEGDTLGGMGNNMCMLTEVVSTALVGPNSLFREGLKGILQSPYQAGTVAETIDSVQKIAELDLIILIADTDQAAVLDQVRRAKGENPNARIVVMGDTNASEIVRPLLTAGVDGCLLKKISLEALRASLDAVMLGGTVVLPAPRSAFAIESTDCANTNCVGLEKGAAEAEVPKLDAEAGYKKLSDRETEILLCLTRGESNKHIARKCDITEATVKVHLKAILRKIRVSNRTQAAVWAHHNYVARPPRLPQAALADFRQDASRGSIVRQMYKSPHDDRVRQNIIVQESPLVVTDSVN